MKKVKIAYCIPALYYPSGMERVLTMKANFLARHGYEVHIIVTDGGDKSPAFPLETSIKVHQLDIDFEEPYHYPFVRRVWLYRKKMRVFRKELDACLHRIKPDITVSLLRRDINIINRMTDGSVKIGEIHFDRLHYRHFSAPWMPYFLYCFIQRRWMAALIHELKKLSRFVVLTHEDAAYWPELENVMVIPNPSSFFPEEQSECTAKQVIAVGRYVSQKGFDRLINAWQLVADRHPDWQLKIYGDGAMRTQLERQITALCLQDSCFLEGTVSDIDQKMRESSIFVLSSRFEGLSMVLIEAMACGLPVVAFACHCGPRDVISDGVDGYLVEDGNISALASRINELIENENMRQALGRNARKKALNYDMMSVGTLWMKLFDELLKKNGKEKCT
ncbi:glycosyltransferase family 4 protein [Bacteroides sp. GD17]|jgi:glycosyltransferase involved in cell wall biosynthesis|uniref:glycosyltransferase family 4 protein n=1 Tax=Bacteroides sp. GD17 TaxID=3139826 RepID=UPI0025F55C5E|nr:glycosyltransferase family 4 protein [uncultured Bacteroides sp.]